jgi:hypothetical protein
MGSRAVLDAVERKKFPVSLWKPNPNKIRIKKSDIIRVISKPV